MSMKCSRFLKQAVIVASLSFGSVALSFVNCDAYAQNIQLRAQTSEIYAGMPFQLSVDATEFDESPQPEIDAWQIEGAEVQFLGVTPRVSSMVSIINGRRTSRKDVTFTYIYQVTPKEAGTYSIPVITARQGGKTANSEQRVTFTAQTVQTTPDMKIVLEIPDRKIWVGETFEARVGWYLRKDVSSQVFSLPLLQMPEYFDVEEPTPSQTGRTIPITVGSRQMAFPYTRDSVTYKGLEYTRFTISVHLTPLKSGTIVLEPSKVLAELESGTTMDGWGFGRPAYKLFRAEDEVRTLEVRELPQNSRPATFSNAMGTDYAIQVQADRTIVKAGDPIVLTIDISSPNSLEGLILPSLSDAGLSEQLFSVSNDSPIGEAIEGAQKTHIKRFTVPVRVKSERVTEIPPLAFSYFNPTTEEYTTVRSQPIALSVTAVEKVSAADVVTVRREAPQTGNGRTDLGESKGAAMEIAAGAVDLGIVVPSPRAGIWGWIENHLGVVLGGIYAFPFMLFGAVVFCRRARRKKACFAAERECARALSEALEAAQSLNAREASSRVANALNAFLKATETPRAPFNELLDRMGIEAYRPGSESEPLSEELLRSIRETLPKHMDAKYQKMLFGLFVFWLCLACSFGAALLSPSAYAQDSEAPSDVAVQNLGVAQNAENSAESHAVKALKPAENAANGVKSQEITEIETPDGAVTFGVAEAAYHKAMETTDRAMRISAFKRAQSYFLQLSRQNPHEISNFINAGNASLGAVDMGQAVLNYKRALLRDPSNEQARSNLAYIQSIQGEDVSELDNRLSSTLFLNRFLTVDCRLLLAAIFFALGLICFIPWSEKHRKVFCFIGIFPLILWVWLLAGYWTTPANRTGVIQTETWLKTADNVGAENVSATPLEPGFSVEIVKERGDWVQVRYSGSQLGWMRRSSVESVAF